MKWEYLNLPIIIRYEIVLSREQSSFYKVGELQFNRVGKKEWELVSVDNGIAFFRRPLGRGFPGLDKLLESQPPFPPVRVDAIGKPID